MYEVNNAARNPTRSKEEQRGRDQNPQKSIKNEKELKRGSSYLFSTGLGLKRAAKGLECPVCIVYRYTKKCTGTLPTKQPNPSLRLAENPKCTGTTIKVYRYKSCTGRNTVHDPPRSVEKFGTQIKHSNIAICKGPVCYRLVTLEVCAIRLDQAIRLMRDRISRVRKPFL
uniref:Uncharacterized protein n=1 Tax=Ananas comosus var. bracteatus TaxID=296719 RepID=A0A6V7Q0D4_ANACO|nr:unnamed protein product [Ananas comosus var. bracteatus]